MKFVILIVAAVVLQMSVSLPVLADGNIKCPPEKAEYVLGGDEGWRAGFLRIGDFSGWISDLAFYVKSKEGDKEFWFLFDQGSASFINLISTTNVKNKGWSPPDPDGGTRPLGETHFFYFTKDFRTDYTVPKSGSEANPYIFLPDLPEILWTRMQPRISGPHGIFVLKSCGAK